MNVTIVDILDAHKVVVEVENNKFIAEWDGDKPKINEIYNVEMDSTRFPDFPVLSTPRLLLRALASSDLDDLYEYASDPEIDCYTPWDRYQSLDEAREDLAHYIARYEQGHFRAWGIEHRADKKLIGITNFGFLYRKSILLNLLFKLLEVHPVHAHAFGTNVRFSNGIQRISTLTFVSIISDATS